MKFSLMNKKHKIFFRFFISYAVILVIAVVIGSFTYNQVISMVEKDTKDTMLYTLDQCRNTLDMRLQEVDKITTQLGMNLQIRDFLNIEQPLKDSDYFKVYQIQDIVKSYTVTNSFIRNIYILFRNPGILVTSDHATPRMEQYYNSFLKYQGMDYGQWYNKLFTVYTPGSYWPVQNIYNNDREISCISFAKSFPAGNFINWNGAFIVLINEQEILGHLNPILKYEGAWYFITDQKGDILCSKNLDREKETLAKTIHNESNFFDTVVGKESTTLVSTSSSHNGWRYVAAIPNRVFMSKVNYLNTIILVTMLIIFITGLIISVLLAYRNSKPIRSIADKIRDWQGIIYNEKDDDYSFIEKNIEDMARKNETLSEEKKKQIPLLKASFFERLFRGSFNSEKEIDTLASYINLEIDADAYISILIQIDRVPNDTISEEILRELDTERILVANLVKQIAGDSVFVHGMENDKIALIIMLFSEDGRKCIGDMIDRLLLELNSLYKIKIAIGIGRAYSRSMDIHQSYMEARQALEFSVFNSGNRVSWYEDTPKNSQSFTYSVDMESRLISLVAMGEKNEVEKMLALIYSNNFEKKALGYPMLKQLVMEMTGSLIRLEADIFRYESKEKDEFRKRMDSLDTFKSVNDVYIAITALFGYCCDIVNEKDRAKRGMLTSKITDFIKSNYSDPDLSLVSVASEFDITEKYLSIYFKEQVGENFSTYLEKFRLKLACEEMKRNKGLPLDDIARKVGYYSANTFYRAFKRVYRVSPSAYRDSNL